MKDKVPRLAPAIEAHKYDAPCLYYIYEGSRHKRAIKYPFDLEDELRVYFSP